MADFDDDFRDVEERVFVILTASERVVLLEVLARLWGDVVNRAGADQRQATGRQSFDRNEISTLRRRLSLAVPPRYAHFDTACDYFYGCHVYRHLSAANENCDADEDVVIVPIGFTPGDNDFDFDDAEIAADRRIDSQGHHLSDAMYQIIYGPAGDDEAKMCYGPPGDDEAIFIEDEEEDDWLDEDEDDDDSDSILD